MTRRALVALALLAGCSFEPDYRGTHYVCKLERCPEGYVCIDELCVTGASDAAVDGADGGDSPSCDDLFGTIDDYELCDESPATCTFGGFIDGSCEVACERFGSTCESAQDSDTGAVCVPLGDTACETTHSRAMCTCVR